MKRIHRLIAFRNKARE
jgi:hypothetical protein